jgi:hypothetical protein
VLDEAFVWAARASAIAVRQGVPRGLAAVGGVGKVARPVGAPGVSTACGIAGFLIICLTDMMGILK